MQGERRHWQGTASERPGAGGGSGPAREKGVFGEGRCGETAAAAATGSALRQSASALGVVAVAGELDALGREAAEWRKTSAVATELVVRPSGAAGSAAVEFATDFAGTSAVGLVAVVPVAGAVLAAIGMASWAFVERFALACPVGIDERPAQEHVAIELLARVVLVAGYLFEHYLSD